MHFNLSNGLAQFTGPRIHSRVMTEVVPPSTPWQVVGEPSVLEWHNPVDISHSHRWHFTFSSGRIRNRKKKQVQLILLIDSISPRI